ncbi:Ank2 [Bovine papular stomatitis virus]
MKWQASLVIWKDNMGSRASAALYEYLDESPYVSEDEVRRLLRAGASVHHRGEFDRTPLHLYMGKARLDLRVVRLLLEAGAAVDVSESCCGCTPLDLLLMSSAVDVEVLKLMMTVGRLVHPDRAALASTLLKEFVINRAFHPDLTERVVRVLVDAGADVNVRSVVGRTPLHICLTGMSTHPGTISTLLRFGADVNAVDLYGMTPLAVLMRSKQATVELLRLLLDAGASVSVADSRGDTLLHHHLQSPHPRPGVLSELVVRGCRVNARNSLGLTPLHVAATYTSCKDSILGPLVDASADIHARDHTGRTPLHAAVCNARAWRRLLARGASATARSNAGVSPLALAISRHDEPMLAAALATQPQASEVASALHTAGPARETACSRACVAYVVARLPPAAVPEPERSLHAAFIESCLCEVSVLQQTVCGTPSVSLLDILRGRSCAETLVPRRARALATRLASVYREPLLERVTELRQRANLVSRVRAIMGGCGCALPPEMLDRVLLCLTTAELRSCCGARR